MSSKPETVLVNLKLLQPGKTETLDSLRKLSGVVDLAQTFPDETDEELATLYLLNVKQKAAAAVLETLRRHPGVDYVERAAPRKLVGQL